MIDRLLLSKPQEQEQHSKGEAEELAEFTSASTTTFRGEQRIIGCVTCTNKFYSAINVAEAAKNNDPSSFIEGRYADVIFRRRGRFGELTSVTEGSRPSGARKIGAKILGKESFDLSSSKDDNGDDRISVVPEGYLTASGLQPINEDENKIDIEAEDVPDEINIVVVVGLLHANGVLECLSRTHKNRNNKDQL